MPRTITTEFHLTQIKEYSWTVKVNVPHAQVIENYVVTDDEFTATPEGLKQLPVEFSADEQAALDGLMLRALKRAAIREEVDVEPQIKPTTDTVDEIADGTSGAELPEEGDEPHSDQVREDPHRRDPVDLGRVGVELEGCGDEHEDVADGDGHHQRAVRPPTCPVDDQAGADKGQRAEDGCQGEQVGPVKIRL